MDIPLALERVGNKVRLLEQTKLPLEVSYADIDNYKDIIGAIKRLDVRGAPAIGIAAAYGLALAVEHGDESSAQYIGDVAAEIKAARPTAVNLVWAVDRVLGRLQEESPQKKADILELLWDEAEKIHREDKELCAKIGRHGSELIKEGESLLTHCNAGALATGGIGTALAVIYTCQEQGKKPRVFADETRPLLQGARLTAWELQRAGVDVTLVCDSVAATLMKQGKVNHVIVGADRIAANGDFANKIGTYPVALMAKEHGIPFYVAAPYSTFDQNIASGDDIVIEERSSDEVTNGFGKRTAPDSIRVYSPAFDVTPRSLVSYYITDECLKKGGR